MGKGRRRAASLLVATIVVAAAFLIVAGFAYANHNHCTTHGASPGLINGTTGTYVGVYGTSNITGGAGGTPGEWGACVDVINTYSGACDANPSSCAVQDNHWFGFSYHATSTDTNAASTGFFTLGVLCSKNQIRPLGSLTSCPSNHMEGGNAVPVATTGAEAGTPSTDLVADNTIGHTQNDTCVKANGFDVVGDCSEDIFVTIADDDLPDVEDASGCWADPIAGGACDVPAKQVVVGDDTGFSTVCTSESGCQNPVNNFCFAPTLLAGPVSCIDDND